VHYFRDTKIFCQILAGKFHYNKHKHKQIVQKRVLAVHYGTVCPVGQDQDSAVQTAIFFEFFVANILILKIISFRFIF
jgi:hypothetical protein